MKVKIFSLTLALAAAIASLSSCSSSGQHKSASASQSSPQTHSHGTSANAPAMNAGPIAHSSQTAQKHSSHSHGSNAEGRVPAFQTDPASLKRLPATLDPAKFTGKTKQAYEAVREIPKTIAQLPCYCYCDQGFGHKSLHSCFVDDHAGHCAVCVDEALMAYRLEKEEKLTPEKIREQIIARYSKR